MIVKKIAAKKGTGSFGGLANYILDKSNGGAKAEEMAFSNCPYDDTEKNIAFIKSMQDLNQRTTQDKTLHIVVSFPEGEKPSKEQLQDIENDLLKSIGMAEHHRLSVTHTNTANYHLHIAVSRIDPITLNRIDPHRDIPKLHKKAEELEEKNKLKRDNHTPNVLLEKAGLIFDPEQHTKSKDIEIHSGVSSLLSWIKEEALDDIKEVLKNPKLSLENLHQVLADYNLELKPRGNGIVIADKTRKLFLKASDLHRDLSKGKLEKRFGEFKTSKMTAAPKKKFGRPVNEYWKRYQELSTQKRSTKAEELRLEKLARETLKTEITKKYAAQIQKIQADPLINKRHNAQARKKVYAQRKAELTALKETFSKKRTEIYSRTKQTSYKEYLMELALFGNEGALKELRKQKQEIKLDDKVLMHPKKKVSHSIFKTFISKVTKQGNAVYEVGKNSTITDKGDHLKVSLDSKSDEIMLRALKMAIAKYGKTLDIQGNLEFKKRVLMVTQKYDLKVNFADPQMQKIKIEIQIKIPINTKVTRGISR